MDLVGTLVIIGMLLLAWGLAYLARRAWTRNNDLTCRTEEHERLLFMLREWLEEKDIALAILRARLATRVGLQLLVDGLEAMKEREIRAAVANLLDNRDVRQVVAAHVHRTFKGQATKAQIMESLLKLADKTPTAGMVTSQRPPDGVPA